MKTFNENLIELYDRKIPPMEKLVEEKVEKIQSAGRDDAFFIVDLGEVYRKLEEWRRLLPRVQPFYALKCNPDPEVARFLADAGLGFDCATKREIEQILQLGVHSSRIVYANPCKQSTHLKYAANNNVDLMTFDSVHELMKIKDCFPSARLLLRIRSSIDHKAKHNFNKKFGCHPKAAVTLLTQAKNLGLQIVGISFHVGSLPSDLSCFASVISDANDVFTAAEDLGFKMNILDIGGGFPGIDQGDMTFSNVAGVVNKALDTFFPVTRGTRIIAEPGRYFVTSAFTLAVNIIAKRIVSCDTALQDDQDDILPSLVTVSTDDHTSDMPNNGIETKQDKSVLPHREENIDHIMASPCSSSISDSNSREKEDEEVGLMIRGSLDSTKDDTDICNYFVNDGIYGSFNNVFTDGAVIWPKLLTDASVSNGKERLSVMWGPTCDGLDCVMKECRLPEMEVGQWLYFHNMGAYTISISCDFNGVPRPLRFYVCEDIYWNKVYPVVFKSAHTKRRSKLAVSRSVPLDCVMLASESLLVKEAALRPERGNAYAKTDFRQQRKNSYRLALSKGE